MPQPPVVVMCILLGSLLNMPFSYFSPPITVSGDSVCHLCPSNTISQPYAIVIDTPVPALVELLVSKPPSVAALFGYQMPP